MKRTLSPLALAVALLPLAAVSACAATREIPIGADCGDGFCDNGPVLTSPPDGGNAEASLETTLMCPVTTCSLPWATCPSSDFPCDANLLNDDDNCGGCGIKCSGENPSLNSKWTCVEGQCVFSCAFPTANDCDNDPSNGCETYVESNQDHCGKCGRQCSEGSRCKKGDCVDLCKYYGYPDSCDGNCTDLRTDDNNCGTCGTVCDPSGPNLHALPADMYYGCINGLCGEAKCANPQNRNCNGDLTDGCEVEIHTDQHCDSCGDACPAGKVCGPKDGLWRCLCDEGETLCGGYFACRRLDDDPSNCGGCNRVCPGSSQPHFVPTCTLGVCGGKCDAHYADCDGASDNGCEVNTRLDNRNCGACGNACLPNQVCSEGKCLVAPCESGELPTK